MGLHIVADENIQVTPALRAVADSLLLLPGRKITNADLRHADALLVRSVTQVTADLVRNTPLRFVGTATAGLEHVDTRALEAADIRFAAAPGSNAVAVVEYVLTAIAARNRLTPLLNGEQVGVVGYGEVGRRLVACLSALGAQVRVWDPWIEVPAAFRASALSEVMACPVVSLHAALQRKAPWPSEGMIDSKAIEGAPAGQLFINAGRGGLMTRAALAALIKRDAELILDTWPDEPAIDQVLLDAAVIATPHIAGYSFDAKVRATNQLVAALTGYSTDHQNTQDEADAAAILSPISRNLANHHPASWLQALLLQNYDITRDDAALRACASEGGVAGGDFDALRRAYPLRRELHGRKVVLTSAQPWQSIATAVGVTPIKQD